MLHFSISLLKDSTSMQRIINAQFERKNLDLCDLVIAQNGESRNRALISISDYLQLDRFTAKYLRLVFQDMCTQE